MKNAVLPPLSSAAGALELIARMVSALELTPLVAVCSFDKEGRVQFCNQTFADMVRLPPAEVAGRRLGDLLSHGERQGEHDAQVAEVWRQARACPAADWQVRLADGSERWLYSTCLPVWHDGELGQLVAMYVDITQRRQQFDALQAAGVNFSAMFERTSDAILLLRDAVIERANPAAHRLFRCHDPAALTQRSLRDFCPLQQADGTLSSEAHARLAAEAERNGNCRTEWHFVDCEGQMLWTEMLLTSIALDGQHLSYVVVRDISERKRAERALHLAAQVFENSRDAIVLADRERRVIAVNRAYTTVTGYSVEELLGRPVSLHSAGMGDESLYREVWAYVDADDHWEGESLCRRKSGGSFPAWIVLSVIRDRHGHICNYMGSLTDITERKQSEEQTRHLAQHDFLTDLPNRVLLLDRLSLAMAAARRNHALLALLFLDLDRFKHVNDSLGHAMGDRLLQEVAARLVKCVREADTVSRQGGDEFVLLLTDVGGPQGVAHVADSVLQALAQEFRLGEQVLHISGSIGIAMFPADGDDIDALMKHADIAMYHAKQDGRNAYRFFGSQMNERIVERAALERGLRRALAEGQFELAYEPEVDIASGAVSGMEALIRWRHPELGLLLPERFIEVAQDAGLMVGIGNWVLQQACLRARSWHDGGRPLVVSVNLSLSQFMHKGLRDSVAEALRSAGLAPQFLELQLTEEMIMRAGTQVEGILRGLRELGVRLSIDDFGTGYSRLMQLKDCPIDKLKIAQSFLDNGTDATAIRTIIAMARSLHMTVIAEGVHSEEQLALLRELGCDQYQGHLAEALGEQP